MWGWRVRGEGGTCLQSVDFVDSSFYEMMSVGWAAAEVDA